MMPLSAFREFFPGGWHVSKAILSGILRWEKRGDRVFWERSATAVYKINTLSYANYHESHLHMRRTPYKCPRELANPDHPAM